VHYKVHVSVAHHLKRKVKWDLALLGFGNITKKLKIGGTGFATGHDCHVRDMVPWRSWPVIMRYIHVLTCFPMSRHLASWDELDHGFANCSMLIFILVYPTRDK
jgi:hypothetical protein